MNGRTPLNDVAISSFARSSVRYVAGCGALAMTFGMAAVVAGLSRVADAEARARRIAQSISAVQLLAVKVSEPQ